jgi:hypothetical protein
LRITGIMVPVMGVTYILVALIAVLLNLPMLPGVPLGASLPKRLIFVRFSAVSAALA